MWIVAAVTVEQHKYFHAVPDYYAHLVTAGSLIQDKKTDWSLGVLM